VQDHRTTSPPGAKVLARTASGSPVPRLSGRVRRSQEQ
jgi:hypothetical protein